MYCPLFIQKAAIQESLIVFSSGIVINTSTSIVLYQVLEENWICPQIRAKLNTSMLICEHGWLVIFIMFSVSKNMIFILFSLAPFLSLSISINLFVSSLFQRSSYCRLCTLTLLPALISRQCRCQARTYRSGYKLPMNPLCSPRGESHKPSETLQRERREGWDGEWSGEGERVSSKLLIKYESILCHLSGHASTSPLRAYRGRWGVEGRGKSIRRTEGRDKCLIHQSNYIIAIKERQLDIMG